MSNSKSNNINEELKMISAIQNPRDRNRFNIQNISKTSGWIFLGIIGIILLYGLIRDRFDPDFNYINPFLPIIDIILYPFGKSTTDDGNTLRIIIRSLANGAKLTMMISLVSLFIGFFIAIFNAVILVNKGKVYGIKYISQAFVDFFRSTPLIVQIFLVYFSLPVLIPGVNDLPISTGVFCGTIALTLNTSAYQSEIIRGGILAIPTGQTEAARALGLTNKQTMRFVILPQAIRLIVPPLTNEIINIILNSSILSVVGVRELTKRAQSLQSYYFMWEIFLYSAVFYFIIAFTLSKFTKRLEIKFHIPGLGVQND
jgi:His/Glu/Gln/Arg/opine family amino acid ABC transporter permease subunit